MSSQHHSGVNKLRTLIKRRMVQISKYDSQDELTANNARDLNLHLEDREAIITKHKGSIENSDRDGTGTERRNGDTDARLLVSPTSTMSNEDVQVTVFKQSGELIPQKIHRNVESKHQAKFKHYAPKDELKRVIKARKMLQQHQAIKPEKQFKFSPRTSSLNMTPCEPSRPRTLNKTEFQSPNRPIAD